MRNNSCSVLVLSCDAYSDLWRPFFYVFNQYWPDCPYRVFLGAGSIPGEFDGVTTLFSESGRDWSGCLLDYLEQIDTKYVLIMLDDFFLRKRVPTERINYCLEFLIKNSAKQIRLIPRPGPSHKYKNDKCIGSCASDMRYRICAQAAIWDKVELRALLRRSESAWDFEYNATVRAQTSVEGFYAVWRSILPYQGFFAHHVIEKGCWLPHERLIFARKNIGCDFSRRKNLPLKQTIVLQGARWAQKVINWLPYQKAEYVRKLLSRNASRLMPVTVKRLSGK